MLKGYHLLYQINNKFYIEKEVDSLPPVGSKIWISEEDEEYFQEILADEANENGTYEEWEDFDDWGCTRIIGEYFVDFRENHGEIYACLIPD